MINIKAKETFSVLGKRASDIARETGINRNTIQTLLRGDISGIKFSTLDTLCATYNLDISDLIDYIDPEKKSKPEMIDHRFIPYKQEGEIMAFTCWPWVLSAGSSSVTYSGETKNFGALYLFYQNNYGIAYWDRTALEELARICFEKYSIKKNFTSLFRTYTTFAKQIIHLYRKYNQTKADTLTNEERDILKRHVNRAYQGFWQTSLFIDAFDTGVDRDLINAIAEKYGLDKSDIEILTTPTERTFADERLFHLLQICIKHNGKDSVRAFLKKYSKQFGQYQKEYDYHKSNYSFIKHIADKDIVEEVSKFLSDDILLKNKYQQLATYQQTKQTAIESVLNKRSLKENPLWFFNKLTAWREHRKKINLMGIHVLNVLLDQVEHSTGIAKKYLGTLGFDEIDSVVSGRLDNDILKNRFNNGIFVAMKGPSYKMYTGEEAQSLQHDLEERLRHTDRQPIIAGQTAAQGYAKGTARIILTQQDFGRFNTGDVLVTSMTRPEFVPLMKKAAGIVTNEGGLTCHAAIVSRELGKPCVIGTKNATQIIRDGDTVEVRANHGTVRILR